MTRTKLSAAERKRVNAAAREAEGTVGRRGKAAPAPAKKKGGHGAIRAVLAVVALAVFALVVVPSAWFAEWIVTPRNLAAVLGGFVVFMVLLLVAMRFGGKGEAGFYVVAVVALVVGGVMWTKDAGSAAVNAGMMHCPKPTKTVAWADAPGGAQCVKVPRCPTGKVPTWEADKATPTGACAARKARR